MDQTIYDISELPVNSGWIKLLHNKRLDSVGNDYYATDVWYDAETKTVSESEGDSVRTPIDKYMLPEDGGMPIAWINTEKQIQ